MSDYFIYVLSAIIVIVGVWFIFAKVLKNKKPKEVTLKDIIAEINDELVFIEVKSRYSY